MSTLNITEILAGYWWLWLILSVVGFFVTIHYENRLSSTHNEMLVICEKPVKDDTDKEELEQRIKQVMEKNLQTRPLIVKFGISGLATIMLLIISVVALATNFKH